MILLREYIREILKEAEENESSESPTIETVGDLKDAIAAATGKKRGKQGKKAAKNFAKSVFIDLFPGMGTISGAGEALKAMYSMPDDKRSGTALDYLDVDDEVSAIVDDPIENAFLKALTDKLEGMADDKPLVDLDMTKLLAKYISREFNKRTVQGFD